MVYCLVEPGKGLRRRGDHSAADIDLNEQWAEVCLACLEQFLAEDNIALSSSDHLSVDGSLLQSWSSHASLERIERQEPPASLSALSER